tara:strand:- start:4252 stop:4458 length:207 start_codon:yes stop_codon:yes gene_type:complete
MYNSSKNINIIQPTSEEKHEIDNYLKRNTLSFECKMDKNAFDPTKNSPPNPWLQKLENRIQQYYQVNQ